MSAAAHDLVKGTCIMSQDAEIIEVTINGFKETVPKDATIKALILKYDELESAMMVERNGKFTPRIMTKWCLKQGMSWNSFIRILAGEFSYAF